MTVIWLCCFFFFRTNPTMFRRLIIWIMLFALPLQGYAAVAMIYCGPSHHASAAVSHEVSAQQSTHPTAHHHANDSGTQDASNHHHAEADTQPSGQHNSSNDSPHNSSHKCSACSACCMGSITAMAPFSSPVFITAGSPILIPHQTASLSAVFLEGPLRPPRTILA